MTRHWTDRLPANACPDAVSWARTQASYTKAWRTCERGDWMLWLAGKLSGPPESVSRRRLVLAACACARTVLRFVPKGESRPRVAIETAERWARRERGASLEDVRAASDAAYHTAATASAAASAVSADAAYYVDTAAYHAAAAGIVRRHYPTPPRLR